ncbi:lactonase family protein [Winogradskyella litoriviva]|uniref:Lactonase family protein n=1 Tax=Winogradskyella litoriviva TaxID=1220182 RepID=A0ABX2E3G4_9FLAO|nr:lactonase family protein [Winogradskyella litoriviva]NRD23030.1 lactonase family protein [Winogradskyella litoriviva]
MQLNKISKCLSLILVLLILVGCKSKKETTLLFVGSFTDKKPGEGIHVYEFNTETGEASFKFTLDSVTNTSFLKLSKNGKYLYSVMESQMPYHGKIGSFAVDSINGKIDLINIQDCGGLNPAHLEIDKTGRFLANSNYSDGSLSMFRINENGSLNPHSQVIKFKDSSIIKNRQEASHMHSSNFSPENNFLFAHDLGADKIRGFNFDITAQDSILQNENQIIMKPGSGPRHFTFHPNGKFGYSIAELSGKITAFNYIDGQLEFVEDYQSYQKQQDIYRAADIHISPEGHFLYASNRGPEEDSISIFSINLDDGRLNLIGHEPTYGNHPRNFAIDPSGKFLLVANQFTDNIVIFRRNIKTGKLTKLSQEIIVDKPSSLQMRKYSINL